MERLPPRFRIEHRRLQAEPAVLAFAEEPEIALATALRACARLAGEGAEGAVAVVDQEPEPDRDVRVLPVAPFPPGPR